MCEAISGVACQSGEDVRVFTLPDSDRHSEIRKHYSIRDGLGAGATRQTPVELVPVRGLGLEDPRDMLFGFNAGCPGWWTEAMTRDAVRQLHRAWLRRWKGKTLDFPGDVWLNSLTSLPAGVTLRADGRIYLRSLTALPKGVTIEAGRDLNLEHLTALPAGVTLRAGGNLDLSNLTALPEGITIDAGGHLWLHSLTVLPEGVTIEAGGNIYLEHLATIAEGVTIEAGQCLWLNSLTSIGRGCRFQAREYYMDGIIRSEHALRRAVKSKGASE